MLVQIALEAWARVLGLLNDAHVNVEYLYSFVRKAQGNALILFKVDRVSEAAQGAA